MKKYALLICSLFLLTGGVLGQKAEKKVEAVKEVAKEVVKEDMPKKKEDVKKSGAVIEFESTTVNFGEIEKGSDPLRTISFTNTGTEPLIISNARGSCGCTVPTWPREPILPGESSEIKIRYDTKRVGPINKTVKLTTNDAIGTHTLRLKGKVLPPETDESVPKKKSILNDSGI